MMALEGASFGFQIGGQATDFVLLVMNKRGAMRFSAARSNSAATCLLQPDRRVAALQPTRMSPFARKFCRIRVPGDCSPASLWLAGL